MDTPKEAAKPSQFVIVAEGVADDRPKGDLYGLSEAAVADLRFYWGAFEAYMGHSSLQSWITERLQGRAGKSADSLPPIEQAACWTETAMRRARRVYRTLEHLTSTGDSLAVTVLYALHGEARRPEPRLAAELGPLALLAAYVPLVLETRDRLARDLADERIRSMRAFEAHRLVTSAARIQRADAEIVRANESIAALGGDLARARSRNDARALRASIAMLRMDRRCAERRREDALRPALSEPALARAAEGIRKSTDREVTRANALRHVLMTDGAPRGPAETKAAHRDRTRADVAARATRVATIRMEADELARCASAAYERAAVLFAPRARTRRPT